MTKKGLTLSVLIACWANAAVCFADRFSPEAELAGWAQVEALQRTPVLAKVTEAQLLAASRSEHAMVRIAGLSAISRSQDVRHLDLVISHLKDQDELTSRFALAVLTQFRGKKVRDAFLDAVDNLRALPNDGRFDPLRFVDLWEFGVEDDPFTMSNEQRQEWVKLKRGVAWQVKPLRSSPRVNVETALLKSSVTCGDDVSVLYRLTPRSDRLSTYGIPQVFIPDRLFLYSSFGTDWMNHVFGERRLVVVDERGSPTPRFFDNGVVPVTEPITCSSIFDGQRDFLPKGGPLGPGMYIFHSAHAGLAFFIRVQRTTEQEASIPGLSKSLTKSEAVQQLGYLRASDALRALCKEYRDVTPPYDKQTHVGWGNTVPISACILKSLSEIGDPRCIPALLERPLIKVPCSTATVKDSIANFGDKATPYLEQCLARWNDCETYDDWISVSIAIDLFGESMSEEMKSHCEAMMDTVITQNNTDPTNMDRVDALEALIAYFRVIGSKSPMSLEAPLWRLRHNSHLTKYLLHFVRLRLSNIDHDGCQRLILKLWQNAKEQPDSPEFVDLLKDIASHRSIAVELPL